MKIVVTGATSFVGAGAVKELLFRGHEVYAVVRPNSSKRFRLAEDKIVQKRLTILEEDLGTVQNLREQIKEPCDVFLQMGWRGAGSDCRKDMGIQMRSAEDALLAAETAKELGCKRFLFTGSQAEYGIHHALMSEETVCSPKSPYGEAKLMVRRQAEKKCLELGMDYGHARIFSTYGPGDHPWSLVSTCLDTFLKGGHMELGPCTQQWNFLYLDDAGRALADLVEYKESLLGHGCVYNLGGSMDETRELSWFVEKMYEICGKQGTREYGKRPPNAEGIVNLIPDISKMKQVLGWTPRTRFEQGILNILRKL